MKLEISYETLKRMVLVGGLLPFWNKVYWKQVDNGGTNEYHIYVGIAGGWVCKAITIFGESECTHFDSVKVSANEFTTGGADDGYALAARTVLALL